MRASRFAAIVAGVAAVGLAGSALAQNLATGPEYSGRITDTRTGRVWTPNLDSLDAYQPTDPNHPVNREFNPRDQQAGIPGMVELHPKAELMGTVPITAGPTVPIMTIDRLLTTKKACTDYIGWIGSNFVTQGQRAADAMIKVTGGKGDVAILLGASGVNVTVDRTKGFKDQLAAKNSGLKVVAEQTGDFTREKGQKVTEQLITANPKISAIYAENDEMALGAVAALKAADKKAGDVKIITIDGTKGAVQGIVDGWVAGVIESNPRFGPLAFQALDDFYGGKGVPEKTIISDKEYTADNARAELANAY